MIISPIGHAGSFSFCSKIKRNKPSSNKNLNKTGVYSRPMSRDVYAGNSFCTYDSFTGLRDKNYLLKYLNLIMGKNLKSARDTSLTIFDMDNFKSINELLGYKTGDDFIKRIANIVSQVSRENNINAYRFGGEEFVIVFGRQNQSEQENISKQVVEKINKDEYINSKRNEYLKNAKVRLYKYEINNKKIENLLSLNNEKSLLKDLRENLATEESKNDPYLLKRMQAVEAEIKNAYLNLIDERIKNEPAKDILFWLNDLKYRFVNDSEIRLNEETQLLDYLKSEYDKAFETFMLKKWISDFNLNNGFAITGANVVFSPDTLKDKEPIDLINIAGEYMKDAKANKTAGKYIHTSL